MKKKILLMLCMVAFVACLFTITAFAATDVNGIWYNLDAAKGTAVVTNDNATKCDLTDVVIPETFTIDGVTYTVTTIAVHAFSGSSGSWGKNQTVKTMVIPSTVTSIGAHFLRECRSIEKVTIYASDADLYDAEFYGCTGLKEVYMAESKITVLGGSQKGNAFTGCSSLTTIEFNPNLTYIASATFKGCSSLERIEIPDSVTAIESWAFNGCSKLSYLKLPKSLTKIGNNCIQGTAIKELVIPHSTTTIAKDAIPQNGSLEIMYLPKTDETESINGGFLNAGYIPVIIYPGDFENAQWLKSNKGNLSGYTLLPFSDFDPNGTINKSKRIIYYGATTCSACNGLLGEEGFIFKDLLTEMNVGQECMHCGIGNYTDNYAPVFVDMGYSVFELNGKCSIVQGFMIDYTSLAAYNENCDAKLGEFGVLAVAQRRAEDVAFDENGVALNGVTSYEIKTGHTYFEIKISNIPANEMLDENTAYTDAKLHLSAYVYVGDEIYYISEDYVGTTLGDAVSYNDIATR